jgi:hypothetical protein
LFDILIHFLGNIDLRQGFSKKEILIYIGQKRTQELENKMDVLIDLFLHIDFKVFLYWQYHFGILGVEDTMKIENMVLY